MLLLLKKNILREDSLHHFQHNPEDLLKDKPGCVIKPLKSRYCSCINYYTTACTDPNKANVCSQALCLICHLLHLVCCRLAGVCLTKAYFPLSSCGTNLKSRIPASPLHLRKHYSLHFHLFTSVILPFPVLPWLFVQTHLQYILVS